MAFVFASTSALDKLFRQRAEALRRNAQSADIDKGVAPIRRPYRGIQIKNDTYATIQIVDGAGNPVKLISESYTGPERPEAGKGQVDVYADFILQNITEERVEKQQIVETFGDSFVFFFGERPRMLSVTGVLVNTEDFGWRAQFMHNYEEYLRGSRLVQRNARMFLSWDTIVVEGYPINVTASEAADNPYTVNFQMQIFLTNYNDFGRIGVIDFPNPPRTGNELDVLNRDLEDREAYASTAKEVRLQNFLSRDADTPGWGIGAFIREGIKGLNGILSIASGFIQDVSTALSGRVVRKPVGIAGFLSQVGTGTGIAGGVLGVGITEDLLNQLASGGLNDVKLKIPRRPLFAIPDKTLINGRISMNYDEYPLYETYSEAGALLGRAHALDRSNAFFSDIRKARRDAALVQNEALLVAVANLQEAEAGVLENIQDLVNLTKTGFAIVNTARAVIADPGGVALDALGLSGVAQFG